MYDLIAGTWHWSISGLFIALTMFALLYAGKTFGFSSNLRSICSIAGAGKQVKFFDFDWKAQRWNLVFAGGTILGGFIAYYLIPNPDPLPISDETLAFLHRMGMQSPGEQAGFTAYMPPELFAAENLLSVPALIAVILGGFLVGFGARWAGGCTSGHAISGLSNLQLPSLIAVIGFFVGGLLVAHFVLPHLLTF